MKIVLLATLILTYLSYVWSVIGVFKRAEAQLKLDYGLLQVLSISIWGLSCYLVFISTRAELAYVACFAIELFCLISFWYHSKIVKQNNFSLVFSRDIPQKLVTAGFYSRIRHPFYAIYLLSYLAIAILLNNSALYALVALIFAVYIRAARFEEKKFSLSPLASAYAEYKKSTGMLIPKV